MSMIDVAKLEDAGRSAMAWTPEDRDARTNLRNVLGAMIPAMGIIATAAVFLTAIAV
jgi:flagellar motor component MotA